MKILVDCYGTQIITTCHNDFVIAEKVGFQDYKYFTQVFKKIEGYPPSKLRKDNT